MVGNMACNEETTTKNSFGRRSFLKGSAALLGLAAMSGAGCAQKPALEEKKEEPTSSGMGPDEVITQGVCRGNCGGGCRMNVHVRDGKVVKTSKIDADDPLDTRICQKGLSHAQRIYAPERLQYPMRRVEGTARGAGEWERITWDEAIDEIATKWKGYISEFGPYSIAFQRGGAGTYAYNQYVYTRLCNMIGGIALETGYDMAGLEIANQMVANYASPYLAGNDCQDVKNSKYIFTWGCNPTISTISRWAYIREAVNNGAKHIVIDPIYTDAAAKADLWVPIRAGSDAALALAMTNIVINENLTDEDYLAKNTVAPFLVKATDGMFLHMSDLGVEPVDTGKVNSTTGKPIMSDPYVVVDSSGKQGKLEDISKPAIMGKYTVEGIEVSTAYQLLVERVAEWTPEKAAEICDIPAATIKDLAHMFAEGPSTLNLGFGNDHWGNGDTITHAQFTLALVAGQWGKPGTGISGNQGQAGSGMPQANFKGMYYPEGAPFKTLSTTMAYLPDMVETGMYGQTPTPIKTLFIACSNFLTCFPDRNKLLAMFDKIELIINCETVLTDTARYSDIVLPVPHWFEYTTFLSSPTPYVDLNEQAIPPQFESKEDIEIAKLLGDALGYSAAMDLDTDSFHEIVLDTDGCREAGITWEALKEKKHIQHAPLTYIYGNVDEQPFRTSNARANFYFETVTPRFNIGQTLDVDRLRLPSFEPPIEAWTETVGGYERNPLADKYPLNIISHRDKFKVHSTFAPCPWFTEIQPEPTIEINPVDASARGINEGDYVRAFNDRGECVFKAHLDAGMRPGMIWTEHTWWEDQYVAGYFTTLLSATVRHFKPAPEPFDALCEVEKYVKGGN